MIDLSLVGAHVGAHVGTGNSTALLLGIFLPGISEEKGYTLYADLIHSTDQFTPDINAFPLKLKEKDKNSGLWQFQGDMEALPVIGNLGKPGKYLYRYRLLQHDQVVVLAFSDPYAVLSGIGTNSAFDFPGQEEFRWTDSGFKVPDIQDLIMYEMMVDDFVNNFEGVIERLTYLESLGVNCIELMPVTNIPEPYRWGYMPMSFFAIEERYGGKEQLKRLINACHAHQLVNKIRLFLFSRF